MNLLKLVAKTKKTRKTIEILGSMLGVAGNSVDFKTLPRIGHSCLLYLLSSWKIIYPNLRCDEILKAFSSFLILWRAFAVFDFFLLFLNNKYCWLVFSISIRNFKHFLDILRRLTDLSHIITITLQIVMKFGKKKFEFNGIKMI